ncbi:MAG: DNA-binding transcriptional LysR family regulator [Oleispira sp.]|jgi:DNA-binding transcriptional LysR family regulator
MDWKHIQFDWNHARAFLVVADEGSLSAAGRALGMSQPTLGRQVAGLEEQLKVTLFERVGKGLSLTQSGVRLYEYVKQMAEAANQFSLVAQGQSNEVSGEVCISLTELDAYFRFAPLITKFKEYAPNIQLELQVSNAISDLKRREADVAIRYQRPTQVDLITKKIGSEKAYLYGHKDYIKHFANKSPDKVSNLQLIGFDHSDQMKDYLLGMGFPVRSDQFTVICKNQLVQLQMILQGGALAFLPDHIANRYPELEPAFVDYFTPIELEMWLVCHRELHTSKKVRLVFDFLSEQLGRVN